MPRRQRIVCIILVIGWLVVAALSLGLGTTGVSFGYYWARAEGSAGVLIGELGRVVVPRLVMATLAGAALAVAGAMFQALFRNPLASPYTLGVSSAASLGAAVVIMSAGGGLWYGIPKVSLAAFAGALVCVAVVYSVASLRPGRGVATLLLAGITIGFICSALIVLVLFLAGRHDMTVIVQWMMGSVQVYSFDPIFETAALLSLAGGLAIYLHRSLDLLMMGEQVAASRGVAVGRSRLLIYVSASLLTGAVVAHCGPIGFVGLMVPHIGRFLVGASHRFLLPTCALAGGVFLPLCDLLARNALWWLRAESRQVPVGVVTSLIGGMFFLYLLLRRDERAMV